MRQTLMLATMALMTACGANSGNTPWDQNHDGLISACEGLNLQACDATPGCGHPPVLCQMICRDDGQGGCLNPCGGADLCRPVPPTPAPLACDQLSTSACSSNPACEVVQQTICSGHTEPVDPSVPSCGVGPCQTITSCVTRAPVQCEQLDSGVCLAHPGCALESLEIACANACDPSGNCPPCAPPQPRCVTQHPSTDCGARDLNVCAMDGRCVLEQGPVCDAVCDPDGSCPPCANPSLRCVPAPIPDVCAGRDPSSCEVDGRCTILAWACTAECRDDGNGGCLPCEAPAAQCVPVASRCEGLQDRASCQAAGCEVIDLGLACTTDCRDDGHGGCLPCKDFACSDGSSSGSGGGTPPPQP